MTARSVMIRRVSPRPFGATLRRQRERYGLTQQELAERAIITQSYLAMLETGERENPSLDIVRRLARALELPLKDLL